MNAPTHPKACAQPSNGLEMMSMGARTDAIPMKNEPLMNEMGTESHPSRTRHDPGDPAGYPGNGAGGLGDGSPRRGGLQFTPCRFSENYQRNNRGGGLKNIKCFPSCRTEGHRESAFCGNSVQLALSLYEGTDANRTGVTYHCFGQFRCAMDPPMCEVGAVIDLDAIQRQCFSVQDGRREGGLAGHVSKSLFSSVSEPSPSLFNSFNVTFKPCRWFGWHYGWVGHKSKVDTEHCFRVYAFAVAAGGSGAATCISTVDSPPFRIFSTRRRRVRGVKCEPGVSAPLAAPGVGGEAGVRAGAGEESPIAFASRRLRSLTTRSPGSPVALSQRALAGAQRQGSLRSSLEAAQMPMPVQPPLPPPPPPPCAPAPPPPPSPPSQLLPSRAHASNSDPVAPPANPDLQLPDTTSKQQQIGQDLEARMYRQFQYPAGQCPADPGGLMLPNFNVNIPPVGAQVEYGGGSPKRHKTEGIWHESDILHLHRL
jgi:hypothetical protein